MNSNEEGAYIVNNESIDGSVEKIIYQVKPYEALVLDGSTGEERSQTIIDVSKVAKLDPLEYDKVTALYINKEAKYCSVIYSNGVVEVVEYDVNRGDWYSDWSKTIGPSSINIQDDMEYARTQKFSLNENNDIIDVHFRHDEN